MRTLMMAAAGFVLVSTVRGQVTQRVSVTTGGGQASALCTNLSISADGRYVAFQSAAPLVPSDTNTFQDVFVRDRRLGTTERVSVASGGAQGNGHSGRPSLSADARYVAFWSDATNLVTPDNGVQGDAFVRDRQLGTTDRVSVSSAGVQGNAASFFVSISADGRFVAFESLATNLVPGDTNGARDVFVHDRQLGTTERVSVDSVGVQGDAESWGPSISADGGYVAFYSLAANLVPGDTPGNNAWDVFVRDRLLGATECVSVDLGGAPSSWGAYASISATGRYVAFTSASPNLVVVGDTNGRTDVFVRDRLLGTTELASVDSAGIQGDGHSYYPPSISADGRYVAFASSSTNLVPGDTNGVLDVFVRDRQFGTTERASVDSAGIQGDGPGTWDYGPPISANGRYVSFASLSTNLVPGDTNGVADVFLRDRFGRPDFTSLCDPGVGGVIACPCSNPPSGPGRGCDNSASTGGAVLSATGGTYLSSDSLVFTTSGERPTALSIVTQWTGPNPAGAVFGQGVRCTSGALKRLYTKSAVGGGIRAPEFGVGEFQVSTRSAALGDVIVAGQSRWHFVYYRDPFVLGGCPSTSTFNATQTGQVTWSP